MSQLNPCARCGEKDIVFSYALTSGHHAWCPGCGKRTKDFNDREGALTAWNTMNPADLSSLVASVIKEETLTTDPDTGGQKCTKLARFDLIPTAPLWELAEHYGKGARKYEPRQWEKGYAWSLSYQAMQRHVNLYWSGEDYDTCKPDCPKDCAQHTGSHHLAAAAWHCFTLMEFARTHPEKDDRVKK